MNPLLAFFRHSLTALYLLGLGIYMGSAVWFGSVKIVSDSLMPYELGLVVVLIVAEAVPAGKSLVQVWRVLRG